MPLRVENTLAVITDPERPVPNWATEHTRVVRVSPDALDPWISSPTLTALVIGCVEDFGTRVALARRADEAQPNVPLILLGCAQRQLRPLGDIAPDLVLPPTTTATEALERLDEFVHGSVYSAELVGLVADAAESALALGFVPSIRLCEGFIRTSRLPGHDINAVVPMCGPRVSGRLSVSASSDVVRSIRSRMIPDAAPARDHDLEDVVAEMSNQVMGAIKRALAARDLQLDQGTPWTYVGARCPVRYRTRTASLLMEARSSDVEGGIVIDLALDSFRADLGHAQAEPDIAYGELSFL